MNQTAQPLIYATPRHMRNNNIECDLKLYVYKYVLQYGNGMLLIAAKNEENASRIVKRRMSPMEFIKDNLETIWGANYIGREGILSEQSYHE